MDGRISPSDRDARFELVLAALDQRMDEFEHRITEAIHQQGKIVRRHFYVSNAAMVLAVATLAFGAARLA